MRQRTVWRLATVFGSSLALAVIGIGCAERHSSTGSGEQSLLSNGGIAKVTGGAVTNLNVVAVRAGRTILLAGYDDGRFPGDPLATFGWATTQNPAMGPWVRCTGNTASCNGGSTLSPSSIGNISNFNHWVGKPTVVSDRNNNVAYIGLYSTNSTDDFDGNFFPTGEKLMAVISENGGTTFGKFAEHYIELNPSGFGEGCDSGQQDLPNAAIDTTTEPPTVWVVWRNKQQSSFGGCIAAFQMKPVNGHTSLSGIPLGQTFLRQIDNMDREFDGCQDCGQGGLRVAASDGLVTVAYSNDDSQATCVTQFGSTPMDLAWETVTTVDGDHWTPSDRILHTPSFGPPQSCVFQGTVNTIPRGLREFDFIVAPDGNAYAAVNDTDNTIRLYMSTTRGVRLTGANTPNDTSWREYCEGNQISTGSRWNPPGEPCGVALVDKTTGAVFDTVWRPTLIADSNSRLMLTFMKLSGGTGPVDFEYLANTIPRGAMGGIGPMAAAWQHPSLPIEPFSPDQTAAALGLYNGGTVLLGMPDLGPACFGDRNLVPVWPSVVASPSGTEEVMDSTVVSLTPPP